MTSFAPISSITLKPNRQRREFDLGKLNELREGIEARGLLHPIVCRREGDVLVLVAGERRLRAIKDLYELSGVLMYGGGTVPHGQIPFNDIGELSRLEAMEAEWEENYNRSDLTWQEAAQATQTLAKLRTEQAMASGLPSPSVRDIAKEVRPGADGEALGSNLDNTKAELIVAQRLSDPEVAGAKTLSEAIKIVKRKDAQARNTAFAASIGTDTLAAGHRLIHADSRTHLTTFSAESFDVILTDPPYGMGADEFGDSGGKAAGEHYYDDSPEAFNELMKWFVPESFRLAKPQAHLYCFCDIDWFPFLKNMFAVVGWKVFRTPLIWYKPSAYRAPWPDQGPQRKYETCLFAVKGDRPVVKVAGDVIECQPDENLGGQAQKPVALFRELLSRSVQPGDAVLDPFCGTGPILPAAHGLKCYATAIEQEQALYGIAAKRLQAIREGV